MKPLVIIPTFLREQGDLDTTVAAVKSVRHTAGMSVDIQMVDDGSPEPDLVAALSKLTGGSQTYGAMLTAKPENEGFSKTVNVGLKKARDEGRDAILMNADVEIDTPGWVREFRNTMDSHGNPAGVVGALLLFPDGLIQHAGIYFSYLTRTFDHYYKFGPGNLPAALRPRECPVTAALHFIRHETLTTVGLYDETFKMGWEDVDYCIRVFLAQRMCVYNPKVRAYHHEMKFRGRKSEKVQKWQAESWQRLAEKYRDQSFADFVPFY